jgi:hypothetical protein
MCATTICKASIRGGDIYAGKQDCMWTRAACRKDSSPEDITRDNRILITRVGTIRTQERAIGMGVTSIDTLPLRFHCIQRN